MMRSSHLHMLLVVLLLMDSAVGHSLSGPPPSSSSISSSSSSSPSLRVVASPASPTLPASPVLASGPLSQDTRSLLSALATSANGRVRFHGNVSCRSLWRLPRGDSLLARELLSLAELPLLLSAGCQQEALSMTHGLYRVLGRKDTHALVRQLTQLLENSPALPLALNTDAHRPQKGFVSPDDTPVTPRSLSEPSTDGPSYTFNPNGSSAAGENNTDEIHFGSNSPDDRTQTECHLNALMFNIQQLARVGSSEGPSRVADGGLGSCAWWQHVKGAKLLGTRVGRRGHLERTHKLCQRLGPKCLGVARSGDPTAGTYQAVLRQGSRVVPSQSDPNAECWLKHCSPGVGPAVGLERVRRNTRRQVQHRCVNQQEQHVYAVVEWVPAVSTLYNLGTAVYYAARNCTDTARERAILSAVDLGTDALMAITGGTVGVAGYALGAGVKTGVKASVKYLMNNMDQGQDRSQDVLVNQESWEDGTFTIQ